MNFSGPTPDAAAHVERILRSLPRWFGIEASLLEYVVDSERYPTFFALESEPVAFITAREHFAESWEVHCMAVHATRRRCGLGRLLHLHAESWLQARRVKMLQVKTLSAEHPSPEYAETRRFYEAMGYVPLEVFPGLWGPGLPVLQLVKPLSSGDGAAQRRPSV